MERDGEANHNKISAQRPKIALNYDSIVYATG